jgi:4-oxalocrotonate tautomerase
MPLVTVKVIEGVFSQQQKQEMISKITDTMVEIEGGTRPPRRCRAG